MASHHRHFVCSQCGHDNGHPSWHFDGVSWTHDCPTPTETPLIIGVQEWSEDEPTPVTEAPDMMVPKGADPAE